MQFVLVIMTLITLQEKDKRVDNLEKYTHAKDTQIIAKDELIAKNDREIAVIEAQLKVWWYVST